jgi:nucleotide-binding universal stress UspA family protein
MYKLEHILVPLDFEPASETALEMAVSLAKSLGAKLTLVHVWELPIYPYMDFMLNSELISKVEDAATSRLKRALDRVQKELPSAESRLKTGMPFHGILEAIAETKADLVVMGTHGRRGLMHGIAGSVAEKVVRLSEAPVLTVHAATQSDSLKAG